MSVLSLAEAKSYLRIVRSDDDVELQATIDSAEATVADRVGPLEVVEVTERVQAHSEGFVLSLGPFVSSRTASNGCPGRRAYNL